MTSLKSNDEIRDSVRTAYAAVVETASGGTEVEQTLNHDDGLRPACTAIRAERCGIGQNQFDIDVNLRDGIDTGQAVLGIVGRNNRSEGRDIGPHSDTALELKCKHPSVGVECHSALKLAIAACCVSLEAFEPGVCPFNGSACCPRGEQNGGVLRIGLRFHAKAAADIVRYDPDILGLNFEDMFG